jgi:hypothetical protein
MPEAKWPGPRNVGSWPFSAVPTPLSDVGYPGHTGKHLLALSFTGFDPTPVIGRIEISQCSTRRCTTGRLRRYQFRDLQSAV